MNDAADADSRPALPPNARLIIFALWLLVFTSGSQVMLIAPIFPRIREQLQLAESALGALVAVDAVMLGLVALVAGPISDRIGRRRILLIGSGLMTVALALHAFAFDYVSLLVVRGLAGAAGGVLTGAAVAYVGDYFPYARRGWATGWVMTGMAFGQIIGIPAGTLLAAAFGFRMPYIVYAAAVACTFVLVWRKVPQPDVQRSGERLSVPRAVAVYRGMLATPAIRAAVIAFALMFFGNALFVIYLPTWLELSLNASPGQVALLFFTGGIATVIAGPRAGQLSDRIGRKGVIITASIGMALLVVLLPLLARSVGVAFLIFFFVMAMFAARMGPFQALLTQLVPSERRGSLMSLTVGIGQLGFAAGSAMAAFAFTHGGFRGNTAASAIFQLVTAAIVWRLLPEPRAGAPAAPAPATDPTADLALNSGN
jgi:predicted MFS family arabinose efflux permease